MVEITIIKMRLLRCIPSPHQLRFPAVRAFYLFGLLSTARLLSLKYLPTTLADYRDHLNLALPLRGKLLTQKVHHLMGGKVKEVRPDLFILPIDRGKNLHILYLGSYC